MHQFQKPTNVSEPCTALDSVILIITAITTTCLQRTSMFRLEFLFRTISWQVMAFTDSTRVDTVRCFSAEGEMVV